MKLEHLRVKNGWCFVDTGVLTFSPRMTIVVGQNNVGKTALISAIFPEPHKVPGRAPDKVVDITTRPDQALVYRLCGDRNPLHSDPEFAKKAGFPRPILHGMCTYGITCRGVLQTYADYDPAAFRQHAVRFSSPVYPGETVTMDLWKDGNVVSFEAKVKSRNVTVIKSGKTVLA